MQALLTAKKFSHAEFIDRKKLIIYALHLCWVISKYFSWDTSSVVKREYYHCPTRCCAGSDRFVCKPTCQNPYSAVDRLDGSLQSIALKFSASQSLSLITIVASPGRKELHRTCWNSGKRRIISDPAFPFLRFLLWIYAPDNDLPSRLSWCFRTKFMALAALAKK